MLQRSAYRQGAAAQAWWSAGSTKFVIGLLGVLWLAWALAACAPPPTPIPLSPVVTEPPTPQVRIVTPTPQPEPPKVLTVCLGQEPADLYLYGTPSLAKATVLDALYDGPIDPTDYGYRPVILEKLPSLADGDAAWHEVTVAAGETIVDVDGRLTALTDGVAYLPSGCHSRSCAVVFDSREQDAAVLDQLVVTFKLLPGVRWADGEPVTAEDSVFAFRHAPPSLKKQYTAAYTAQDEHTVQWVGLPGYHDPTYFLNFWAPLPAHRLPDVQGQDLSQVPAAAREPLGWGAYAFQEWVPGDHITLVRNPYYFRAAEGLPHFDALVFRFVGTNAATAVDALLAGECDILDQSIPLDAQFAALQTLEADGKLLLRTAPMATTAAFLYFGIHPAAYDDGWQREERPDYFGDPRVRQALAMCIDRRRILDEVFHGLTFTSATYLPPGHPLYNDEATLYPYDPVQAGALLTEAGWVDDDGDPATPRVYQGEPGNGLFPGTPFRVQYLVSDAPLEQAVAQRVAEDLRACGVEVELTALPAQELFQPGPEGVVFGRRFDLVQMGFATGGEPPCSLWRGDYTPGDPLRTRGNVAWMRDLLDEERDDLEAQAFLFGWGGTNIAGYFNPEFDRVCAEAQLNFEDVEAHAKAHRSAQSLFAADLPAVPLFFYLKIVAARPDMCGLVLAPLADSALWHVEAFDYGVDCAAGGP